MILISPDETLIDDAKEEKLPKDSVSLEEFKSQFANVRFNTAYYEVTFVIV